MCCCLFLAVQAPEVIEIPSQSEDEKSPAPKKIKVKI